MLTFGYLGESGNMNAWFAFGLGFSGWMCILYEIYFGEAGRMAQKAAKINKHIGSSYNTLRLIATVGWSIYPMGYFFGYLLHQWGDSPCNLLYNMGDVVNRLGFCLIIWHAAKRDTLDALGHGGH